jgi:hypothetical protein
MNPTAMVVHSRAMPPLAHVFLVAAFMALVIAAACAWWIRRHPPRSEKAKPPIGVKIIVGLCMLAMVAPLLILIFFYFARR